MSSSSADVRGAGTCGEPLRTSAWEATKSLDLKSYMHVVVSECDDFLVARYVLTTGPKANQNPSFT